MDKKVWLAFAVSLVFLYWVAGNPSFLLLMLIPFTSAIAFALLYRKHLIETGEALLASFGIALGVMIALWWAYAFAFDNFLINVLPAKNWFAPFIIASLMVFVPVLAYSLISIKLLRKVHEDFGYAKFFASLLAPFVIAAIVWFSEV